MSVPSLNNSIVTAVMIVVCACASICNVTANVRTNVDCCLATDNFRGKSIKFCYVLCVSQEWSTHSVALRVSAVVLQHFGTMTLNMTVTLNDDSDT